MPSKEETDTVESMVGAESVSRVEFLERGVGCAMGVAAARAFAARNEYGKTEAKTVPAAGEIDPRPVQLSAVAMEAGTRATNVPGGAERPSILIRGSCVRKS